MNGCCKSREKFWPLRVRYLRVEQLLYMRLAPDRAIEQLLYMRLAPDRGKEQLLYMRLAPDRAIEQLLYMRLAPAEQQSRHRLDNCCPTEKFTSLDCKSFCGSVHEWNRRLIGLGPKAESKFQLKNSSFVSRLNGAKSFDQ